jgi:hypothetical protein
MRRREIGSLGREIGGEQAQQLRLPVDVGLGEDLLERVARRADRDAEPVRGVRNPARLVSR